MTGFFERLAARASGDEVPLALRPAHPFEEALGQELALEVEPAEDAAADAGPQHTESAGRAPATETAELPPARQRKERGHDLAGRPSEPEAPRTPARRDPPARRVDVKAERKRTSRPEPEASATAQQSPPLQPAREPPPPEPRPRETPRPKSPFDLAGLLREHVVPALVDRGVVESGETPVDSPSHGPVNPPAGKFTVEAGNVTGLTPPSKGEVEARRSSGEPADVHVHIDRVVVTRAPSPPPPPARPPAPPPRSTVDHDAYLARRRERR